MRIRFAQALLAFLLIAAAGAPTAHAYRIAGKRWPGNTITYHNATPYKAHVAIAVRTWNASGVRVRFRAASRSRARVLIRSGGRPGCEGRAQLGFVPGRRATMLLGRGCTSASAMTAVAAHELGHILGLQHEDRRCAAMNTRLGQACEALPAWSFRCRYLETDDVAGAVRRYGGSVKPVSPQPHCPIFAAPQPPGGLALAFVNGSVDATVTIVEPARNSVEALPVIWSQLYLWRYPDACPPDAGAQPPQRWINVAYGPQTVSIDTNPARGTSCYAAAVQDAIGRRSPVAVAAVVVP